MSLVPPTDSSAPAAPGNPVTAAPPGTGPAVGVAPTASLRHTGTYLLGAVAIAALVSSGLLWQKLNTIQEQLARQSADAGGGGDVRLQQRRGEHQRAGDVVETGRRIIRRQQLTGIHRQGQQVSHRVGIFAAVHPMQQHGAGMRAVLIRASQRFHLPDWLTPDATIENLLELTAVLADWS